MDQKVCQPEGSAKSQDTFAHKSKRIMVYSCLLLLLLGKLIPKAGSLKRDSADKLGPPVRSGRFSLEPW